MTTTLEILHDDGLYTLMVQMAQVDDDGIQHITRTPITRGRTVQDIAEYLQYVIDLSLPCLPYTLTDARP